ncbi:MAG: metallophosphoesterase [Kofleriaceae bacterium]
MTQVPPPRVREHDIAISGLDPRHDGVRVAQLSDLHVGNLTPPAHIRAAIDATNAANVDVVVLTGDYVCWRRREALDAEAQLGGLRASRVLAVLGNHDYMTWASGVSTALLRNGYEVLRNQHTTVELRGAPLQVVGIDDPVTRHHDLDGAFRGVERDATCIALCHSPRQGPAVAERGADLVLSGHTHGGQIFVPGVTDRIMRSIGLRYRSGRYAMPVASTLYVTPGVGFSGVTRRVGEGTDAEVAVFTLRAA